MKKPLLFLLAVAVAGLLAVVVFLSRQTYVVKLTEAELQEHLERGFPLEKGVLIFSLELTDPKVTLKNGSERVHFRVNVGTNIQVDGLTPKGTAAVETSLRYAAEEGAFYLSDPVVDLDLDTIRGERLGKMNEIANLLLRDFAGQHPVYRLKKGDLEQSVARAVLRDVRVEDGMVNIYLGFH